MQPSRPGSSPLWKTLEGFAATHCTNCSMGWTRYGANSALTVCLLDRQPVLTGMTNCDQHEPDKMTCRSRGRFSCPGEVVCGIIHS